MTRFFGRYASRPSSQALGLRRPAEPVSADFPANTVACHPSSGKQIPNPLMQHTESACTTESESRLKIHPSERVSATPRFCISRCAMIDLALDIDLTTLEIDVLPLQRQHFRDTQTGAFSPGPRLDSAWTTQFVLQVVAKRECRCNTSPALLLPSLPVITCASPCRSGAASVNPLTFKTNSLTPRVWAFHLCSVRERGKLRGSFPSDVPLNYSTVASQVHSKSRRYLWFLQEPRCVFFAQTP